MRNFLFTLCFFSIFAASCSMDQVQPQNNTSDQVQESEQVSNIPTPIPDTPEAVYLYPSRPGGGQMADSPADFVQTCEEITLKFQQAKKIAEIMSKMMPEAVFAEGERSSRLLIKARPEDLTKARSLIAKIDRPSPQIMIESTVLEVAESDMSNLGVSWNLGSSGIKFTLAQGSDRVQSDNISATVSALLSGGHAKVVANPRIAAMDNTEASVNIGSRIPYAVPVTSSAGSTQWTVQYIDAGVSLKITPYLGADGMITVVIRPEVSSVSEWKVTPAGEFPVISTRNAQATIRVKNGQTIVIGGLIDESDRENISKLPIAGDIPIIKALFTKRTGERSRTEVIFLITPKIS